MPANKQTKVPMFTRNCLPYRDKTTAAVGTVVLPANRAALFLALDSETLHDKKFDELAFSSLSDEDKAAFQLLLYVTYCCKGHVFQVTLENPDFGTMSPAVREDFSHGRLFCFVLDMDTEAAGLSFDAPAVRRATLPHDRDVCEMLGIPYDAAAGEDESLLEEVYKAFMRLQLVRVRATSLNNAMVGMRDSRAELSPYFDWVDITRDTLNSEKIDKKKVRELQGSMLTPVTTLRQAGVIPKPIADMNLKTLERSLCKHSDSSAKGTGERLLNDIFSKLTARRLKRQKVMRRYLNEVPSDKAFLDKLTEFALELDGRNSDGGAGASVNGLLVFEYDMANLVTVERPDSFVNFMIHKHVPVSRDRTLQALSDIGATKMTRELARVYLDQCYCKDRTKDRTGGACKGDCQAAYCCFYNTCARHPFVVSQGDHTGYFDDLYPHLGKLERLSKEMKVKHKDGRTQFETIAEMVFKVLTKNRFVDERGLYQGLRDVMRGTMKNSYLSIGQRFPELHEKLCRPPVAVDSAEEYATASEPTPVKLYDRAVVRYLFSDHLNVGRLYQASTTFNYIIANTAPRYTIERIMLFNTAGPGEGKSYANYVLTSQFKKVPNCIETLTSFTPQAFKYTIRRESCVVMIDDGHITHEKNARQSDQESNVIPNVFKNLLDQGMLASDVVMRDPANGSMDTVRINAVNNCGFVWNTNTMDFVSRAWADRSLVMESEFPRPIMCTRSTKQILDTVERCSMDEVVPVCLYRQNLIQSATMIAESEIAQFTERFDKARNACLAALRASHILCVGGTTSHRLSFCINQLVYAEALKLACHFVFDIWIPPWTTVPNRRSESGTHRTIKSFMTQLNKNRLAALNKLSFGQICLETNSVYKLCTAACLPDIVPRVVDTQGRFACETLARVLASVYSCKLKHKIEDHSLSIWDLDTLFAANARQQDKGAHEMLQLCASCNVPGRKPDRSVKLCTYTLATMPPSSQQRGRRGHHAAARKVKSVKVPLEAVYDMCAMYMAESHRLFWQRVETAMAIAYRSGSRDSDNAFAQCDPDRSDRANLSFRLDFEDNPLCSLILKSTAGFEPLNELSFTKCTFDDFSFQCAAPVYYGGVLVHALGDNAPLEAHNEQHMAECALGPIGAFHGPRLSVYSTEYTGVPVENMSSFCNTRTVYHQDTIRLTVDEQNRPCLHSLEKDWEWKDAATVFNKMNFGDTPVTVDMLRRDYSLTMMALKSEDWSETISHKSSKGFRDFVHKLVLNTEDGMKALARRGGLPRKRAFDATTDEQAPQSRNERPVPRKTTVSKRNKM